MSWFSRLLGGKTKSDVRPQRLDYLNEALVLERQGDYDAALTSYRLALRDTPNDLRYCRTWRSRSHARVDWKRRCEPTGEHLK